MNRSLRPCRAIAPPAPLLLLALPPLLLLGLLPASARAGEGPFPQAGLPPELAPWAAWALDDDPDLVCPKVAGSAVCVWPGVLALRLDASGGSFVLEVQADREAALPLPGDPSHWPQEVSRDGTPLAVLAAGERPVARIPAGRSQLAGRFRWTRRPELLPLPPAIGLVALTLDEAVVPFPRRDEAGTLWLQASAAAAGEEDRLDLEVARKLSDGIPLRVTTRLTLRVAGRPREVVLGRVGLAGAVPLDLSGDLPARFDPDGALRVQARAGTYTLELLERLEGSPEALQSPTLDPPWPGYEVWVWEADTELRQVELAGPPGIDRSRTNLVEAWQSFPAYLLQPGDTLKLTTVRRGEPEPPPDQLVLRREFWLDLDGEGFTVRDTLGGTLSRSWRLDLAPPAALGHVALGGEGQLVTAGSHVGQAGVELRQGALAMTAESRLEAPGAALPAVGWSTDVSALSAALNLPPGWTLLHAQGVDRQFGAWTERWSFFGFLFVLLVAGALGRLLGWRWGVLALAALVLAYHEPGAARVLWLPVLAAAGLLRVVRRGRPARAVRLGWWLALASLTLVVVPFAVRQLGGALWPQASLAAQGDDGPGLLGQVGGTLAKEAAAPLGRAVSLSEDNRSAITGALTNSAGPKANDESSQGWQQEQTKGGGHGKRRRVALQNDPKAVVQTGPGVPDWGFSSVELGWSGSVAAGHTFRPWLLSPTAHLGLSVLRALLLLALLWQLGRDGLGRRPEPAAAADPAPAPPPPPPPPPATALAGLLLLLGLLLAPATARAEFPSNELLQQLRERLSRPAPCAPDCVDTAELVLTATDRTLNLGADVSVGQAAVWRIPGPARSWVPRAVLVDGQPSSALALLGDGFLHLRLAPGRHRVEAVGPLADEARLVLQLGDAPHRVTARAEGWQVEGVREDGTAESSLQLVRQAGAGQAPSDSGRGREDLPPWLEVTRVLDLGMPWLVHTTVRRASPSGSPILARVPLLPGESVTESAVRTEGGEAVVSLGQGAQELSWSSTLAERGVLTLQGPTGKPWSEIWTLRCSPIWHCAADGLPPLRHQADGRWEPTFRPWPGETLTVTLSRPAGIEGQSMTLDQVRLRYAPGRRAAEATLTVRVRSSQGGPRTLTLPPGAKVQRLVIGGAPAPLRREGDRVQLNLPPGEQQVELSWRQEQALPLALRVPAVGLGGPAANVRVTVEPPRDRWLLWLAGPSWGPVVLFWPYLLLLLGFGLALSRRRELPLGLGASLLLAIGAVRVPPLAALLVLATFGLFAWRKAAPPRTPGRRALVQLGLLAWTAGAAAIVVVGVWLALRSPEMFVLGGEGYGGGLTWYVDRVLDGALPQPLVLSVPSWIWQAAVLLWSLWLVWAARRWIPWGRACLTTDGFWRSSSAPAPSPPAPASPPAGTEPGAGMR